MHVGTTRWKKEIENSMNEFYIFKLLDTANLCIVVNADAKARHDNWPSARSKEYHSRSDKWKAVFGRVGEDAIRL